MNYREENDLLMRQILKQCEDIKSMIHDINANLKQQEEELTVSIAETIANKGE